MGFLENQRKIFIITILLQIFTYLIILTFLNQKLKKYANLILYSFNNQNIIITIINKITSKLNKITYYLY